MKALKQIYLLGALALIGVGIWIIGDRWYGLVPIGFGVWTFYSILSGHWFKSNGKA